MNGLSHHLYAQACNNAWSNLRLLRACAALDDAEFAAPRTGFFEPLAPFATSATLAPAQREVDRRLIALCAGLTDLSPTVSIQRADHVQREPLVRVLAHLFQHQIHHRGQAHAMLAGTAVKPPQLDEFFLAEEAPLRADELAALGLREADIWPGALSARAADGTEV